MALYHDASVTPTKAEMIETWLSTQPWYPDAASQMEVVGAFRFDDPGGEVGLETHLVVCGDTLVQIPLSYRPAPLAEAEAALIGEMEHTALGTRWVYDALGDPLYLVMLAGVAMTGQGEALGMVQYDGRWFIAPANVRIQGGGWTQKRVAVDEFVRITEEGAEATFRNDGFELTVHRRPTPGDQPPIGLTARWDSHPSPVVLAEVQPLVP